MADDATARVDAWIWSVRLTKTRSIAATACRAGHVKVNGERAKPAQPVRAGDEIRLFHAGRERIVVVRSAITKRVGAPVAAECFVDNSPPPPTPVEAGRRGLGGPAGGARRPAQHRLLLTPNVLTHHSSYQCHVAAVGA
ncbi:RNA-binding S4 domain-containing protein, partial [Streptomyces bambusae]|nr:hypothetical protein [Streptomyces bambusae]